MDLIRLLIPFTALFILTSCSKKSYLERKDEDKALMDAVKKLSKNPGDDDAAEAIPILYQNTQKDHLGRIASYSTSPDIMKWDIIINEYQKLQNAYEAIINSPQAFKLLTPVSYSAQLLESRESAAEEFYRKGETALALQGRDNAKKAFAAFNKANGYSPGYKESVSKMQEAMNKAMVNVVVYPIQDNAVFSGSNWSGISYRNNADNLRERLISELSNRKENEYAARFFTDREAYRQNIKPDWIVDMVLRRVDIPYPSTNSYSRSANKDITTGTDSSGRPITQRVYANIQIIKSSITAVASMDITIKDVIAGKNISNTTINEDYRWERESATYTGDSRALSTADLGLINNIANNQPPSREEILNELYRKLYPRVKSQVTRAVEW